VKKDKKLPMVTGMPRTDVAPDGSYAEMDFTVSNGVTRTLRFDPSTLLDLMSRLFQLVAFQRMQKAAASGHGTVKPIAVVVAAAQEAVGGKAVVLLLRMQNGVPVEFALQPDEATELHRQLGLSIEKAKQQLSSNVH
jgi:hypothetical protein